LSSEQVDRSEALLRAEALINGPRAVEYGDALENLSRIATGWSVIAGTPITAAQVAMMMAWLKMARVASAAPGDNAEDSYVDLLGYGALACELHWRQRRG
jgi:hypothetical protein